MRKPTLACYCLMTIEAPVLSIKKHIPVKGIAAPPQY
jgi:hypothetical protein